MARTESYDADYSVLLGLFVRLVQSQAGKKIEPGGEWLNDAQTLALKLFRHLVSIQTIAGGTTVTLGTEGGSTISFVDHASAKVIARAAFETYLVFFFIYGDSDMSLGEFRHKAWQLGGLVDRQAFHPLSPMNREIMVAEKEQLETLRTEVRASPHFGSYTDRQSRKLLDGDWRIARSWADLGRSAGFHKTYFNDVYGYLCGYSHSSYISAMQVGQAQSIADQKMLTEAMLGIGVVLMAHFTFSYSNLFGVAREVLCGNPAARRVAEKWRADAERMGAIYGR